MTEINDYLKLLWPRVAQAFCPSCEREIRPETAKSIADDVLREFDGQTVLLTFWVSVPLKTDPREFFQFLQQQGYLRVWLNGEIVRADTDKTVGRLGARVQVIQDRITISEAGADAAGGVAGDGAAVWERSDQCGAGWRGKRRTPNVER